MDVDIEYEFDLEQETTVDYQCSKHIVEWLKENMESLEDTNNNKVFSKVNYGYNQDTIKGFGKKPVCDVYINSIKYSSDFIENIPSNVTSYVICYLKGNMNNAYLKACELTDYLIQEFNVNENFRRLSIEDQQEKTTQNIVRDTYIRDVKLQIIPSGKTYGVLCAFELEHELC